MDPQGDGSRRLDPATTSLRDIFLNYTLSSDESESSRGFAHSEVASHLEQIWHNQFDGTGCVPSELPVAVHFPHATADDHRIFGLNVAPNNAQVDDYSSFPGSSDETPLLGDLLVISEEDRLGGVGAEMVVDPGNEGQYHPDSSLTDDSAFDPFNIVPLPMISPDPTVEEHEHTPRGVGHHDVLPSRHPAIRGLNDPAWSPPCPRALEMERQEQPRNFGMVTSACICPGAMTVDTVTESLETGSLFSEPVRDFERVSITSGSTTSLPLTESSSLETPLETIAASTFNQAVLPVGSDASSTDTPREIACGNCGKVFDTKRKLKQHTRYHLPRRYLCIQCGKGWVLKKDKTRHMRETHATIKNPCKKCGTLVKRKWNMKRHLAQSCPSVTSRQD